MPPSHALPKGWERRSIADLFDIRASGDIDWARWSREQDANHLHPVYANGRADSGLHGYASYAVEKSDAITLTARGTLGELGFAFFRSTAFTPIGRLLVLRSRGDADARFFASYINGLVRFAQENTGVAQLTAPQIARYQIDLPPLAEQYAISTALSDVDALIAGLEKLIAKKRDLKQAAMQQLLTGQTRLPGFSGDWASRSLGSLGATYGGLVGKGKNDFGHGSARYVPFVNVMANIRIDCGALEPVNVASTENQNRVLCGDLLFNGSSETPEEVALCALMTQTVDDLYLNSFCFGFRFKQGAEASGLFLTYLMRSQMGRELMKSLAQGSTRYNLSKSALLQARLVLPNLEEQTAIATVLSDMDADLSALEARLAKTRDLKQGMMQELLTGRTRLV
jgi:type I restriction enzyme S subunit